MRRTIRYTSFQALCLRTVCGISRVERDTIWAILVKRRAAVLLRAVRLYNRVAVIPWEALVVGKTLGRYKVLEKLGSGGMGEVFVAQDTKLARKVALKILPPDLADSPERRERFEREARAVAALSHPNVLAIHDFGEDQGVTFAVTELLKGKTLRERLDEGTMSPVEAIGYARQIVDGLAAAHASGIVHRDLKPENLFVTRDGKIKVLDFGLAKQAEEGGGEDAATQTRATEPGTIMGTVGYMSPEQVRGQSADARSDVFSFGAILYEMLTGERAFDGESAGVVMSAILKEDPAPLLKRNPNLPPSLEQIVDWCLKKNPDERLQTALDVGNSIEALSEETTTELPAVADDEPPKKKGRWKFFLAFLLIFAPAVGAIWFLQATSELRWAREKALPEIVRLVDEGDYRAAFTLAKEVEAVNPDSPLLDQLWPKFTREISIRSTPPGADVYAREYGAADSEWTHLGETPIGKVRLLSELYEFKIDTKGFATAQIASNLSRWRELDVTLDEGKNLPAGMVRVAGDAPLSEAYVDPGPLPDYWIDKYEVTNQQFKQFVDSGGYESPDYWKHEFVKGKRVLSWEEAMSELTDATGRSGPTNWELGDYPEGEDDYPVTGVSWYEAAAYADFAGKLLPTIYHWNKAAGTWMSEAIIPHSNFGRGAAPVGSHRSMSPYGSFDMAGNAREWCSSLDTEGRRFLLGGGWNDADYLFFYAHAQDPFDRSPTNGFRCMSYTEKPEDPARLTNPVEVVFRDYRAEHPVSDEIFAVYKNLYRYDKTELDAKLESEEVSEDWIRQTVSLDAAYGDERMLVHLFLPKKGVPPFQVVAFFPGSDALMTSSSDLIRTRRFDFLMKSGRAVLHPIYKGTFERSNEMRSTTGPDETTFWKEHVIMWSKDLGRSLDYLETREDIDTSKLAYYGFSLGGGMGPVLMALEARLGTGVLPTSGFWFRKVQPEVDPINFLPRVTTPVLMLNGRYDSLFPPETSQKPFFELLGTPPESKKMFVHEEGHGVPRTVLVRETLDWLDRYLGPVS